ncbi:MAG TPA: CBS domain-containing protein, partial [Hellea balneolensis]|nr:CBS domain-containing protein [Hellea balneolensis]
SSRIRHVPVVEEGRLRGLVSIGDVVKRIIADTEKEIDLLKEYIST